MIQMNEKEKKIAKGLVIAIVVSLVLNIFCYVTSNRKEKMEISSNVNIEKNVESKSTQNAVVEKNSSQKSDIDKNKFLVDAQNVTDYSKALSPEDFETVKDDKFSFVYPKNFFVSGKKNGNTYTFEGSDQITKYEIFSKDSENDDPKKEVNNLKSNYVGQYDYLYFEHPKKELKIDSSGMARRILCGYTDSSKMEQLYVILASDGKTDIVLTFSYPTQDTENVKNPKGTSEYLADCIYRGASFGGGTYKIRTYQQFKNEDMGEKK